MVDLSRTIFLYCLPNWQKTEGEMRALKVFGLFVVIIQLIACGGGGSSSNTASPATTGACATAANCALPSSVSAVPPQN